MKKIIFLALLFLGCAPRYTIYDSAMLGGNTRTEKEIKDDGLLLISETEKYGSPQAASKRNSDMGWACLRSTDIGWSVPFYQALENPRKINAAMRFFNRAWLLDSSK